MNVNQKVGLGSVVLAALFALACGGADVGGPVPDETQPATSSPTPTAAATTPPSLQVQVKPSTAPRKPPPPPPRPAPPPPPPEPPDVYYANCDEARQAGAAPIHRGEPGYRRGLDRDGDGTACDES